MLNNVLDWKFKVKAEETEKLLDNLSSLYYPSVVSETQRVPGNIRRVIKERPAWQNNFLLAINQKCN